MVAHAQHYVIHAFFAGYLNSSDTAIQSVSETFTYQYMYNIASTITSLGVDSIIVNWPRAYVSIFLQSNGSNTDVCQSRF